MDQGEVTVLTLLDLSAAFDTIDHATLTNRLSDLYGISGLAQIWFSSYLQNRQQSVKIKGTLSDKAILSYGVQQGSGSVGPVLFTLYMYTTSLSAIISSFDIDYHLYADDTQIYMSLSVSNAKESFENLQHCVMAWITGSKLKRNPSKTEFLLIGTKLQREKYFPMLNFKSRHKSICISQKFWCSIRQYLNFPKTHITNM